MKLFFYLMAVVFAGPLLRRLKKLPKKIDKSSTRDIRAYWPAKKNSELAEFTQFQDFVKTEHEAYLAARKINEVEIQAGMQIFFDMFRNPVTKSLFHEKFSFLAHMKPQVVFEKVNRMLAPKLDFGFRELMEEAVLAQIIEASFLDNHINEQLSLVLRAIESTVTASWYLSLADAAFPDEFAKTLSAIVTLLPGSQPTQEAFEDKPAIYARSRMFSNRAEMEFKTATTYQYQGPIVF